MPAQVSCVDIRLRSSTRERRARLETADIAVQIPTLCETLGEGALYAGDCVVRIWFGI